MTDPCDEPGGVSPDFTLRDELPMLPAWVQQHLTFPHWLRMQRAQYGKVHPRLQAGSEHCPLGGWLRGGGWRRYGNTAAHDAFVKAHDELHAYVETLAEGLNASDVSDWQPGVDVVLLHPTELAFARACTALMCLAPRGPDRSASPDGAPDRAPEPPGMQP